MSGSQLKLDHSLLVTRTSEPEAALALALDLRELQLQDIEALDACRALQVALLSQNLLNGISLALFSCGRLQKLDLAHNGITALPSANDWARLEALRVLYLHDNQLGSLQAAGALAGCASLMRLTLFGNPCAKHPSYRHYCVNTLFTLRALDLHVISDEELIEGAVFTSTLGTKCPKAELPIFTAEATAAAGAPNDRRIVDEAREEIRTLNSIHARLSPVLRLQASARGGGARRRVAALRLSVPMPPKAPVPPAAQPPPPPPPPPPAAPLEIDVDEAASTLCMPCPRHHPLTPLLATIPTCITA